MSGHPTGLAEARRALAAAESLDQVRQMLSTCAPRFHHVLRRRMAVGPRPDLGMHLAKMPGRAGFTSRAGDSFFVSLGSEARTGERRFTLAHELAHTLLDAVDRERISLDCRNEEELCELFARRALAPPDKVRAYFNTAGFPRELNDLAAFVRTFGVSLRAGIVALDEFCPDPWPVAFIGASWRSHPRGDGVFGMRIDASMADRRLFFPAHCRVATLGYTELEAWVMAADPGDCTRGADTSLRLRSRRRGVSTWTGSSTWSAQAHLVPGGSRSDPGRGLLACIDVAHLSPVTARRRRSTGPLPTISAVPGQLCLQ